MRSRQKGFNLQLCSSQTSYQCLINIKIIILTTFFKKLEYQGQSNGRQVTTVNIPRQRYNLSAVSIGSTAQVGENLPVCKTNAFLFIQPQSRPKKLILDFKNQISHLPENLALSQPSGSVPQSFTTEIKTPSRELKYMGYALRKYIKIFNSCSIQPSLFP